MNKLTESNDDITQELSDDMEVIGPGQMLLEGRKALGLTQADIAKRLNFNLSLVESIENEKFDKTLPSTFNRGYLRSFAKMVHISQEEVLASYDMLDIAEKQGAEMQSFSQNTKKQAEHSRLMWISYLVVAILIGSTIFWFFQESASFKQAININPVQSSSAHDESNTIEVTQTPTIIDVVEEQPLNVQIEDVQAIDTQLAEIKPVDIASVDINETAINTNAFVETEVQEENDITSNLIDVIQEKAIEVVPEVTVNLDEPIDFNFVFSGDCWVNIYDATGERVAYGVKKKGYIMNFKGLAPLNVTVARPEFVMITYQDKAVELSQFAAGNIAKFTLPLAIN